MTSNICTQRMHQGPFQFQKGKGTLGLKLQERMCGQRITQHPHIHPLRQKGAMLDQGRPSSFPMQNRKVIPLKSCRNSRFQSFPYCSLLWCLLRVHWIPAPSISYPGGFVPSVHGFIAIQLRLKIIQMPPFYQNRKDEEK